LKILASGVPIISRSTGRRGVSGKATKRLPNQIRKANPRPLGGVGSYQAEPPAVQPAINSQSFICQKLSNNQAVRLL